MQEAQKIERSDAATPKARLWGWLDRRTGVDTALRSALYEPIPGGARFAYVFGSGLLFIFISQIITGVFLALYYVPSADHAHTTVAYITKAVTAGSFLRSLHAYGASAMIIVLLLHLSQTYIYGSYKGPREILWVSGCVLFALVSRNGLYRVSVGMGPAGILCHRSRNQCCQRSSPNRRNAEAHDAWRHRDGHSCHFAIFCRPRFLHSRMRLCAGGSAHSFVSKGRSRRAPR